MYLTLIILPLLGSLVAGFFGRKVGSSGSKLITTLGVGISALLAVVVFFEVAFNNIVVTISLTRWLDCEFLNLLWEFSFDGLQVAMLIPVLVISTLVHIYSIGYMRDDPHNPRFFAYLSLFTFMMILLVTGNNYLVMFVGWEGIGVSSYLLVNFWFTRIAANQSSLSAILTNRVGDCFLTIALFTILWGVGDCSYSTVFSLTPYLNESLVLIIGICLLLGAMAKSSQLGLHVWLPASMEGPTPVSALIHAATLVTAGIYLLIRSSALLEYSPTVLLICLWLGAFTTVFSSLIGFFQQDIKKVIAYSTISQLGVMVMAIGLSSYNLALFHLVNHAFYKALLFLGAGAVIHSMGDKQDLRKYGGLISYLPFAYSVAVIASMSLVAIPFMTGFYSKDFILESSFGRFTFSSVTVYAIAVIAATFTTLYSIKVIYLTFLTNPNGNLNSYHKAHESDWFISFPLIILAIFSIIFGYLAKDLFVGLGNTYLFGDNSIFIHPVNEVTTETEFGLPLLFKLLPFILTLLATLGFVYASEFFLHMILTFKLSRTGFLIYHFFSKRFFVEYFYNEGYRTFLRYGASFSEKLDAGNTEFVGPKGIYSLLIKSSKRVTSLTQGVVTHYGIFVLVGIALYLGILIFTVEQTISFLDVDIQNYDIILIIGVLILSLLKTK